MASDRWGVFGVLAILGALTGCSPKIGDHCAVNTDCGSSGTLICDTAYPGGYCTQFNCTPDVCQNTAACVEIAPVAPGCPYDDYHSPARTGRTFCLAQCHGDSDCRTSDGYVCRDPRKPPYNAAIIDDVQSQLVCVPGASYDVRDTGPLQDLPEGSVCSVSGPVLDAALPLSPAPADSSADSSQDAADAPADGSADVPGDVAADVPGDAPGDAPASDATGDAPASDATGDGGAGASDAADEG